MALFQSITRVVTGILLFLATTQCCTTSKTQSSSTDKAAALFAMGVTPPAISSTCGHSKYYHYANEPGVGIVGGVVAKQNAYPWLVRLSIETDTGIFLCGGSIISNNYILTAGHCLHGYNIYRITVYFADHDTTITDIGEFNVSASTSKLIVHPNYSSSTLDYDFALLQLKKSVNFGSWTVQKICLPTSCDAACTTAGSGVYIAGWGTTYYVSWTASKVLRAAYVLIGDWDTCKSQYDTLTDNMICAGYLAGGVDTCQGDSGGPLMSVENGYYKLCGVVSYGRECALANKYGVYSKVCSVLPWIAANSDAIPVTITTSGLPATTANAASTEAPTPLSSTIPVTP